MKKFALALSTLLLLIWLSAPLASAYDYRTDSLYNEQYFSSVSALEKNALDTITSKDFTSLDAFTTETQATSLDYASAVRVYTFKPTEFMDALSSGFTSVLNSHNNFVWKIPVVSQNDSYAFVIIDAKDDKNLSYSTFFGDKDACDDIPLSYIYSAESVDTLLSSRNFDSVYITSIPTWNIDFVTMISGNAVEFIPYAARPDFVGIKNGSIYSSDELTRILKSYSASTHFYLDISGSGAAASPYSAVFTCVAIVSASAVLFLSIVYVRSKRA